MDQGLPLLFRLMSASWVFIGKLENENEEKLFFDEADYEGWYNEEVCD